MLKHKSIILLIISAVVIASVYFHLPSKIVYKSLPILLKLKYGVSTEINSIKGGFRDGIVINSIKFIKGANNIKCDEIATDIKFLSLILRNRKKIYNVNIKQPKIRLDGAFFRSTAILGMPFYLNTNILISGASLFIKNIGQDHPILFNGELRINNNNIKITNLKISLDGLDIDIEGGIGSNGQLDLSAHFLNSENKFKIKGLLASPEVYTHWSGLETLFKISDIKYENNQLIFSKISGNVYIKGFPPLDLDGGLCITKDYIKLDNLLVLKSGCLSGVIARDKPSRIRLTMDSVSGAKLAEKLPEVLRIFILSHKVKADVSIYGMMNNLQGGGVVKLLSAPIEIACRYRNNIFSFRSIGEGALNISGSINWNNIPSMKIRGFFNDLDIKEFMALIGKETDANWCGIVKGEFNISGELESPFMESKLEIKDAEFGGIKFDMAYLNLKSFGHGPLNLEHSMIYYNEIPAELKGFIDPKEKDIFKNIEICPKGEGFIWEGVNIVKDADGNVIFGKNINENISIRFKSILTSDPGEAGKDKKPEVELEYKIKDDNNVLIKMEEDGNTIGVKRKVKF